MSSIFTNNIAMDVFCYDLIEEWIEYRKSKSLPFTEDDYYEWFEYFEGCMQCAYEDCIEDEEF